MTSRFSLWLIWCCFHSSLAFSPLVFSTDSSHSSSRGPLSTSSRRSLLLLHSQDGEETKSAIDETKPFVQTTNRSSSMSTAEILRAMGTSPRRIFVSALSATGVALAANFLGLTSALLSQIPESTVEMTGLDTYYPRAGFKRYNSKRYTFLIPQEWVGDTALELQKAQLRAKTLDYSMRSSRKYTSVLPDVAFGPPGRVTGRDVSSADINVSVIVSDVLPGFSLEGTLGTPEQAAEYLLKGMKRDITLIGARLDGDRDVYELVYQVNRSQPVESLQCTSVIGFITSTNTLITQTVVAPVSRWADSVEGAKLGKVASSFRLITETK